MTENHRYTLGANLANNDASNPFSGGAALHTNVEVNSKLNNQIDFTNYYSNSGQKDVRVSKNQIIDTLFDDEKEAKTIDNVFGLDKDYENETFAQGFHIPVEDDKFTILENDSPVHVHKDTGDSKFKQSEIKHIDDLISKLEGSPDTERKKVTDIDIFSIPVTDTEKAKPKLDFFDTFKEEGAGGASNRYANAGGQDSNGIKNKTNVDFLNNQTNFDFLNNANEKKDDGAMKRFELFAIKEEVTVIRSSDDGASKPTNKKSNGNGNGNGNGNVNFDFFNIETKPSQTKNTIKPNNIQDPFANINSNRGNAEQKGSHVFDMNSAIDFDKIQIDLKNDPIPIEKKFATISNTSHRNKIVIEKQVKDFNSTHALQPRTIISLNNIEGEVSYGKSKLGKETSSTISLRKSKLFNDDVFSSSKYFLSNKNLSPYFDPDEEVLNYQTQVIFEEIIVNVDVNRVKEELLTYFLDENIHQSPISPVSSMESMLEFTELSKVPGLGQTLGKDVHSWRMILGDGNCFYRAFMFALIESFILNVDIFGLKKLVFDINTNLNVQLYKKNVTVDKSELNIVFYLIIDYLENGSIYEAYDVFMKAYYYYKTFDYGLIKYMRIALYKYIDANKNKIYSAESGLEIGNLLPAAYIDKNGYDFKAFYEEYLLCMHNEAEKIVIYLAPVVFNVNVDLYILEGTAQMQKQNVKFFKQTLSCLEGNKSNKISLLYRFNHYDCLYSHKTFENHFKNISYQINLNRKDRYTVFTVCQCEVCGQESELLSFYHIPNNPLCKSCLIFTLNNIMINRIRAYISEFYINKECKDIDINSL
jgi:hypothetical protein